MSATAARRRVLVTGGSSGIGRAIAAAFLATGDHVVIGHSSRTRGSTAVGLLRRGVPAAREPCRLEAIGADLASADGCRRLIEGTLAALGGLDVLVNNAAATGAPVLAPLLETSDALLDHVVDVNLKAPFRLIRDAAPHLRPAGVIVNVGSVGGFAAQEHASAYCASKGGLELLTRAAALELADLGIRVVGVAPGDIATRRSAAAASRRTEAGLTRYARRTPLGRRGTGDDVAAAVLFAASDDAGFITGTTIVVDGGFLSY